MPSRFRTELSASHLSGDAYEAVALPYQQNELELVAIMPAEGTFDAFVEGLTAEAVARIQGELERSYLDLRFPKLEIKAKVPLKDRLQALGMRQAFEPGADFSALAPDIYISDAFHDATINIDEEGTVAAAATAFALMASPRGASSALHPAASARSTSAVAHQRRPCPAT